MIVLVISALLIAWHALPILWLLMGFGHLEVTDPIEWVILFGLATIVGLGSFGLWKSFRRRPCFKPWPLYSVAALVPLLLVFVVLASPGFGSSKEDWVIVGIPILLLAIGCLLIPQLHPFKPGTIHGDGTAGLKKQIFSGNQLIKAFFVIPAVSAAGLVIYYGASFLREPHPLESSVYEQPNNWLRKRQLLAVTESSDLAKLKSANLLASDELRYGPNYERALILLDEILLAFEKKYEHEKKYPKKDFRETEIETFARIYFLEIAESPAATQSLIAFAEGEGKSREGLETSIKFLAKHREGQSILKDLLSSNSLSDFGRRLAEIYLVDLLLAEEFSKSEPDDKILATISSNHGYSILVQFFEYYLKGMYFHVTERELISLNRGKNLKRARQIADFLIEKQGDSEVAYQIGYSLAHENQREALQYLEFAANKGHPQACYKLRDAHLLGTAIVLYEDNPEKAIYWFEKAALAGHPDAQREVGVFLIGGTSPTGNGGESTPAFHERNADRGYEMLESAVNTKFEEFFSVADEKIHEEGREEYFSHVAKTTLNWSIAIALMSQYCVDRGLQDQLEKCLQRLHLLADWGSHSAANYLRTYQTEGYVQRNILLGQAVTKAVERKEIRRDYSPQTGWIREPEFLGGGGSLTVRNTTKRDAIIKLVRNDQRAGILFVRSGEFTVLSKISDGSYTLIYALGENYDRKTEFFDGPRVDCRELGRDLVFETSISREQRNGEILLVRSYTEQTLTLRSILGNTSSSPISPTQFRQF